MTQRIRREEETTGEELNQDGINKTDKEEKRESITNRRCARKHIFKG